MKVGYLPWRLLLTLFVCVALAGCGPALGVPMVKGQQWLDSKVARPEINVTGSWLSPEWGMAVLKQEDRDVMGMLGDYQAKGVASGKNLYLIMYANDSVHYFADLKQQEDGSFKGSYTKYEIIDDVIKESRKKPQATIPPTGTVGPPSSAADRALLRPICLIKVPASP